MYDCIIGVFVHSVSSVAYCYKSTFKIFLRLQSLERDVQYASVLSSLGAEKLLKIFDPSCKAPTGFGALKIHKIKKLTDILHPTAIWVCSRLSRVQLLDRVV